VTPFITQLEREEKEKKGKRKFACGNYCGWWRKEGGVGWGALVEHPGGGAKGKKKKKYITLQGRGEEIREKCAYDCWVTGD